jgi:SAM-dependent methyltransferase
MDAPITLEHPDGRVLIEDLGSGRKRVAVELGDPSAYMPASSAETDYPVDLIEAILVLRGPAMVGYSIRRAEDPAQLAEPLRHYILAYVSEAELEGKRLLDFGCGSGSSTTALAQLFPRTNIVAVDLEQGNVSVARLRAAHYGIRNATFLVSPGPLELPPNVGAFDFVCMSAVYEHLLPAERPVLMAKLWQALRPGGALFLNQTPHRFYPVEYHTTGLPLLNYVPTRVAFFAAGHLSRRVDRTQTWEDLLRAGIRGATEGEILRHLRSAGGGDPILLQPHRLNFRDQVDVWYSLSMARRPLRLKRAMRAAFKAASRVTGRVFVPTLHLAIRKV